MGNHLQKSIDSLHQARELLTIELDRIEAALRALGGAKTVSRSHRVTKPCCTKSDVIEIVRSLLEQRPNLPRHEIEKLAKEKASKEQGKSLSGFAMRFTEALADPSLADVLTVKMQTAGTDNGSASS